MPIFLRGCLIVLSLLLPMSAPLAETNLGVRTIFPAKPEYELLTRQFRSSLEAALTRLLLEAREKGNCDVGVFDISDYNIETREREKKLLEEGYLDPESAVPILDIPVNTFVDGVVGMSGGEVDFVLEVSGIDGVATAKLEGSFREEALLSEAEKIANSLADKLCAAKPYHVSGGMADLVIDQAVCNVTMPFSLHGTGLSAGIVLSLTPSGEGGGSFSVGGTAGGVPWSGGGTYVLALGDNGGSLNLTGTWSISTPVGKFPGGGIIKTTLTPASSCGEANAAPAKSKAAKAQGKPKKAKKKKSG